MNIKTVIVDDNLGAIESFKHICEDFFPQIKVVAEYHNAKEAYDFIKKNQIDWLILDIDLNADVNGFDLLNLIGFERNFEVIFYSGASDQYLEAIRVHAFEFLSKPFSISELKNCMNRYIGVKSKKQTKKEIDKSGNEDYKKYSQFLKINTHNQTVFVKYNDIIYMNAAGAYTEMHYSPMLDIKVSQNISHIMKRIKDADFLIRISRSTVINKNQIDYIKKVKDKISDIVFKDGSSISVSNVIRKKMHTILDAPIN